jgi:hypothetical protein
MPDDELTGDRVTDGQGRADVRVTDVRVTDVRVTDVRVTDVRVTGVQVRRPKPTHTDVLFSVLKLFFT